MNKAVADLLIVQDRDLKIVSLQNDLKRVPLDKQRVNQTKTVREAEYKKAKDAVQEMELAIRALERDAETRRVTIGRLKQQQFETRKNDEYQSMGKEIVRYGQEVDELETKQLELMEQLDERKKSQGQAREKLDTVLKAMEAELAKCDQRGGRLEAELKELVEDRRQLAARVDAVLLNRYEGMRKSKGLPVVVLMSDSGECGGCHTRVIRLTEIMVRDGKEIAECENCGRILH